MGGSGKGFSSGGKINYFRFMDGLKLFANGALNSLVHTARIARKDIGMTLGIDECVLLVIKRGKIRVRRD